MSHGTGALPPIELAEYLGMANHIDYIDSTGVGGSCWEMFLEHAVAAIAQGQIDTVLLSYGSTSRADLKRKSRTANLFFGNRGPIQFDAPFGHTLIAKHAMSARRHMHEFGTTIEQLAEIAVSARYNAGFNPDAYYRDPITIEDVQSSKMIADPFTKLHCCIRSDGGGAILLTHEERARDCANTPIWVLGTGEAISHTTMSEWNDFTESPCVRSAKKAFGQAGVTPADIDVVEVYDSFTLTVLLTLEGLGFCKKGEGGAFVEGGTLRVGGALPTNTDGGGLSSCQPGMRGIFLAGRGGEAAPRRVRRPSGRRRQAGRGQRHGGLDLLHRHRHPRPGVAPARVRPCGCPGRGSRPAGGASRVPRRPDRAPTPPSSRQALFDRGAGRGGDGPPGVLDPEVVLGTDPRRPAELPEHAQADQALELLGDLSRRAVGDAHRRLGLVERLVLGVGPQQDAQADAPAEHLVAVLRRERPRPAVVPLLSSL